MKAFLKNYRQSPRKVALVSELIKGKRVAEAIYMLESLPKRASLPVRKLLLSAISNAKNLGINEENLFVQNITVDKGIVLKRMMPRARGSASRINKRTSRVMLTLSEKSNVKEKKAKSVLVETPDTSKEILKEKESEVAKNSVKKVVKSKPVKSSENKV